MKKKLIWNFEYKGIHCEIVNWNFEDQGGYFEQSFPSGIWNGYIFINKKQLTPQKFFKLLCKQRQFRTLSRGRKYWDYSKLDKYFDMHGGITYFQPLREEFSGKIDGIQVGCDYAHLYDEGRMYNENHVKADLEKSVDTFINAFPDYKVWDQKDGKYRKLEETSQYQQFEGATK